MTPSAKSSALSAIALKVSRCRTCRLNTVGVAVPGEGSPNARIVFVGEAPGKIEAATGRPFVGRSGKLLRERIREAGLKEEDVFITSALKYLPKHVTPKPKEVEHGRIHLNAQLDIIKPKIIVLLGRVAALAVLGHDVALAKEHGKVLREKGRSYFLVYHPAAALRSTAMRKSFDLDMRKLARLV